MCDIQKYDSNTDVLSEFGCVDVRNSWEILEKRKLTLKETRRVMSLPDDFNLTGKWEQRSERMGRMVPPLMMKAVAEAVYENILKPYKENTND